MSLGRLSVCVVRQPSVPALSPTLAQAQPFAYITNLGTVTIVYGAIDTSSNTVIDTVTVGTNPKAFGMFIGPARILTAAAKGKNV